MFGVVMVVGFAAFQRFVADNTISLLSEQNAALETARTQQLHVAIALAIEPDYFEKPVSHTKIIMKLVDATPGNEELDELGRIREAFRLAGRKDHNTILADYLTDLQFAGGCRGLENATQSLSLDANKSNAEVKMVALAALASRPKLGVSQTAAIASSAKIIANRLYDNNTISAVINKQIQSVDDSDFAVSGRC